VSADLDSLIRMARWGREQGKRNVIADLAPLCEMADELDRLRGDLAAAKAEPPRPTAIVYASEGVLHAFEDYEEAVAFSDEHGMDIGGISRWIWHPKSP
jgi:hypothetical protein